MSCEIEDVSEGQTADLKMNGVGEYWNVWAFYLYLFVSSRLILIDCLPASYKFLQH